jgi:hypothetical protein
VKLAPRATEGHVLTRSRAKIARFGLEPLTDVPGALLMVRGPILREAIIDHVIAFDAERVLNDPGGLVCVIAVDRLREKIAYGVRLTDDLHTTSLAVTARWL